MAIKQKPIMARSKKNEPILIHQHTDWVESRLKDQEEKNKALEQAIWEVKKLFPRKLTDEEAISIIKNGLENEIRKTAGFEKGDLETTLKLLGIESLYETAKKAVTPQIKSFVTHRSDEFTLKKGKVTTTIKTLQDINEHGKVFASTAKQIERYNDLKVLADAFNYVFDKDIIYCSPSLLSGRTKNERIREFDLYLSIEKDTVVPNYRHIVNLKE